MIWIAIIVVLILLIGGFIVKNYNSLVVLRNRVRDQFAQIDVQLKRRFDLIPNLVETIKGYTKHESDTLKEVIEARNKYSTATTAEAKMEASNELGGVMNRLFALAESYPDLKANKSFEDMMAQLKDTEDKIAASRQFYNDTVLTYNNKVETIPSSIIASMFGFKKEAFFEAAAAERENVEVKF